MRELHYSNMVGSLIYSMIGAKPDLAYNVGLISRFMSKPLKDHWQAAKWVLRYLKGSEHKCLKYSKHDDFVLKGYCDSDFANDLDKRRSTTSYVFTMRGNTISWKSRL